MQTQEAITKRRSIRKFLKKEIPKEIILKLLDAARLAPTARNEQPWEFLVVSEPEKKRQIANITGPNGAFIADSSVCLAVFCLDTKYYLEDGCAATENILLMAYDLGVGSCWVAGDKKPYCQAIKEAFGVPEKYKLVSLIALGYPQENSENLSKKTLKEITHWQSF